MDEANTSDIILQMKDLKIEATTGSGWTRVVDGIDLYLRRGEVLGLIGESGAGKSTLGLAALGFVRPGCRFAGGSVHLGGIELTASDENVLRSLRGLRVAYVAQSASAAFNPAHRLLDQTIETAVVARMMTSETAKDAAETLYQALRLTDPKRIGLRFPHQVSGGQLQRVITAMAMICKPDVIVFDEPTTALDVTTQIEVLASIRDAVSSLGTAAIYITHDLAVVAQMAHRIMVLRHGKLVEEADTRQMLSAPQEQYTKSLWAVRAFRTETKPAVPPGQVPLIRVKNIDAYYGSVQVLSGINIDFPKGRTVAIVGESGSGKSTLGRVVSGLLKPTAGKVQMSGSPLPDHYRHRSADQLRSIQIIYQMADTALNPRQRIREIVGRPLRFYQGLRGREKDLKIREIMTDIELDPDKFIDRFPSELSGGQKQRIGIARALAADPEFIICDEVTSALDQLVAEGMLKMLVELQRKRNLTYMYITHDLSTVRAIADHVVVMEKGVVVEQGSRDAVLNGPSADYSKKLLSSVPEMDPNWLTRVLDANAVG
ncbi:ABC transporter [Mesorhizobium sp. Root102]|nr:ABC transporter [Mesorhizobium sp. Root102]